MSFLGCFNCRIKVIILSIILCCLVYFLLLVPLLPKPCPDCLDSQSHDKDPQHHLVVIVPYRNRFEELLEFVPHLHRFLKRQDVSHDIFVMHQVDQYRFNRASLINVGFLVSQENEPRADYIAMHDVDLLPLNDDLKYYFPGNGLALHVSSPNLHPKYHYPSFVGGILLLTRHDFSLVNGMSNKYWGWGLEDDEFFVRLKSNGVKVVRPEGIKTGINDTFLHNHRSNRKRDQAKFFNQREVTRKRDRETGLDNVQYFIRSKRHLTIDSAPFTLYDVELLCDILSTPWCVTKNRVNETQKLLMASRTELK